MYCVEFCIEPMHLGCMTYVFRILRLMYFGNYGLRDEFMIGECPKACVGVLNMLHVTYDLLLYYHYSRVGY